MPTLKELLEDDLNTTIFDADNSRDLTGTFARALWSKEQLMERTI